MRAATRVLIIGALDAELGAFQTRADLVVGDLQRALRRPVARLAEVVDLLLAPGFERLGCGGVMPVTIDDHAVAFA